jgi:hypothetical protein
MPMPLRAAAMVPAVCVPCPLSSSLTGSTQLGCSHTSPSMSLMSVTKLRDALASKFGAMSGWVPSSPVSMTPTLTFLFPSSTWCACGTPIMVMSHSDASSGSALAPFLTVFPCPDDRFGEAWCSLSTRSCTRPASGERPTTPSFAAALTPDSPRAVRRNPVEVDRTEISPMSVLTEVTQGGGDRADVGAAVGEHDVRPRPR